MSAALHGQPTQHNLSGLLHITQALHSAGVRIRFEDIDPRHVGRWDHATQTAQVRRDAHPGNQVWYLGQLLLFLAAGPSASPAAQQERNLRLISGG